MSVHQMIHEMTLRFKDPDAYKEHNKGKVAAAAGKSTHDSNTSKGNSRMGRNSPARPDVNTYTKKAPEPKAAPSKVAAPAPKAAVIPKTELKPPNPIEYSPEIQQAKERVQTYESDILSGKTSNEIYNKHNSQNFLDKYKMNLNS